MLAISSNNSKHIKMAISLPLPLLSFNIKDAMEDTTWTIYIITTS